VVDCPAHGWRKSTSLCRAACGFRIARCRRDIIQKKFRLSSVVIRVFCEPKWIMKGRLFRALSDFWAALRAARVASRALIMPSMEVGASSTSPFVSSSSPFSSSPSLFSSLGSVSAAAASPSLLSRGVPTIFRLFYLLYLPLNMNIEDIVTPVFIGFCLSRCHSWMYLERSPTTGGGYGSKQ
jgi:hypothetical protein